MPCYKPLVGYYHPASGAVYTRESRATKGNAKQILFPCNRCIGCKLQRANDWATRCTHEASLHEHNIFGTFTINDKNLTEPTLEHREWQLFMKRLRKALGRGRSAKHIAISESCYVHADMGFHPIPRVKYYMAGEYGDRTRRKHYHACIFGIDFLDKTYHHTTQAQGKVFISATLNELWSLGHVGIGDVTYESAAYIARYILDKQTGDKAAQHYRHIDPETGEITQLKPEYNRMSLGEGIGKQWYNQFKTDVYPHGYVMTRGKQNKAPKYYDKLYKKEQPDLFDTLKANRELGAAQQAPDNTDRRLEDKEKVKTAQISTLKREL